MLSSTANGMLEPEKGGVKTPATYIHTLALSVQEHINPPIWALYNTACHQRHDP